MLESMCQLLLLKLQKVSNSLYESPWWTAAKNPYKSALSQLIAVEYDSRDIYRHRLQLIGSTLSQVKCLIHVVKAGAFKSSNARPFLLVNTKLSNIRLGLLVLQLVLVVAVEWQSTKAALELNESPKESKDTRGLRTRRRVQKGKPGVKSPPV
ncbi:hypothetical protein ACFX2I_005224 [Malus domestica]